jgi:acyl transferase domain-containing protein/acyl carrier protein
VDWSVTEVLTGDDDGWLGRVEVVQPVLWAVMVSLAALWQAAGVAPQAVIGHSQGEIAAAVVAGALSLDDGARVVALRAKALTALAGSGGMLSLACDADRAAELIAGVGGVSVAAVNGPRATVVSGDPSALDQIAEAAESVGVRARRVPVDYASHGEQVQHLREQILADLAPITPSAARVPVVSTVTGDLVDGTGMDAEYWFTNLRQTVRFADAVDTALGRGWTRVVEVSAHPVLTMAVQETTDTTPDAVVVGTLRRDESGPDRFIAAAATLWSAGVDVDWPRLVGTGVGSRVELPTYAFQRKRYWLEPAGGRVADAAVVVDEVERGFWEAVEAQDVQALTETVPGDGESWQRVLPGLASWRRERRRAATIDSWRYQVGWTPVATAQTVSLSGVWLLVVPAGHDDPWIDTVRETMTGHGAHVVPVPVPVATCDRDGLSGQLRQVLASVGDTPVAGVVSLLSLSQEPVPAHPTLVDGVAATLLLIQAVTDAEVPGRLWCVTTGAVSVDADDPIVSPVQAQVWGMARVVALEQPTRWGGVIDLPPLPGPQAAARVGAVLAQDEEDQVAVRAAGCHARRMRNAPLPPQAPPRRWSPRDTILITGGTGLLGAHLARWLAGNGAAHLVLTSRRGVDAPGARQLHDELVGLGARVSIVACDVTDRVQVEELIRGLDADGERISAVMHTAVWYELGALAATTVEQYAHVVAAKVAGAQHLHDLLAGRDLDAFVVYSSIAALWGSGEHGAYAAANAHLDAWTQQRRQQGLPATAVAWGVWDAVNDSDARDVAQRGILNQRARRQGLPLLDPALAFAALQHVLDWDETCIAVADIEWERFVHLFTSARHTHLLDDLPQARHLLTTAGEDQPVDDDGQGSALRQRLQTLTPTEQDRELLELIRAQAATVLGHTDPTTIDAHRAFREIGFDSLTAVELRNRLTTTTGLRLPATLVFDHPTPTHLAHHLRTKMAPDSDGPTGPPVLHELSRLEEALLSFSPDSDTRTKLTKRLQALLWKWGDEGPDASDDASTTGDDFDAATADDMFDLIDREFGSS